MLTKVIHRLPWLPLSIMGLRGITLVLKFALALFIAQRLGVAELGLYGLVAATSIMLPVIFGLGLMPYLNRQFVTESVSNIILIIRNTWLISFVLYVSLTPIALLIGWYFGQIELALLTLVIALFEHANTDAVNILTNQKRPLAANISFFIRGALWVLIIIPLGYWFPPFHTFTAILYGWLAASIVSLGCFFYLTKTWPWHTSYAAKPSKEWYKNNLKQSWRFYISEIGNATSPMLDRYLITFFLGLEATGVYVLFWSVNNALLNLVITGSMQTRRPQLIIAAHQRQHADYFQLFKRVSIQSLATTALLAAIAAIVFPWVAQLLNRPQIITALPVLYIMLAASVLRISGDLIGSTLYAYQKDKSLTFINFLALPISLVANMLLVPFLGLYGAALAAVTTQTAQLILRAWRCQPIFTMLRQKQ